MYSLGDIYDMGLDIIAKSERHTPENRDLMRDYLFKLMERLENELPSPTPPPTRKPDDDPQPVS